MLFQSDNPDEHHLIQVNTVPQQQLTTRRVTPQTASYLQLSLSTVYRFAKIVIAAVQGEIFSYRVRGNPCSDVTTLARCLEMLERLTDIPLSPLLGYIPF